MSDDNGIPPSSWSGKGSLHPCREKGHHVQTLDTLGDHASQEQRNLSSVEQRAQMCILVYPGCEPRGPLAQFALLSRGFRGRRPRKFLGLFPQVEANRWVEDHFLDSKIPLQNFSCVFCSLSKQ